MSQPPRRPDGRSKPRPGVEAQRAAIVDAAIDLFVTQGSRAISISAICAEADVSRPTFYRCFPDKDALVEHLYNGAVSQPIEMFLMAELPELGDDISWLRMAIDMVFDALIDQGKLVLWLYAESADRNSPASRIVDQAFDDIATRLGPWVGQPEPLDGATRMLFKAVMVACQFLVRDAMERGPTPESRQEAKDAAWKLVEPLMLSLLALRDGR